MYSKIPMPRTDWTKEAMKYAMCFFPVIGCVIGALLYVWGIVGGKTFGYDSFFFTSVCVLLPVLPPVELSISSLSSVTRPLLSA